MRIKSFIATVALAIALAASQAQAATILTWTGGSFPNSVYDQTVGWSFTTNQAITVSALDWYDPTGNNLIQHTIDIWTNPGAVQLGTACVGSGCAGSTWSASYWSTPVSISLANASSYVIGGWVPTNDPFAFTFTATTGPQINYTGSLFEHSASTVFPNSSCCGDGIVGPNFEITATPLPSTWLMLLSGFFGLGFLAYRGTKKNAVAFAAA